MGWFDTFSRSFLDWRAMAEVLPNMITVGLKNTLILAMASTLLGTVIGIVLAIMGISDNRALKTLAQDLHGYLPRPSCHRDDPAHRTGLRTSGPRAFRAIPLPPRHSGTQSDRRRLYR